MCKKFKKKTQNSHVALTLTLFKTEIELFLKNKNQIETKKILEDQIDIT